MLNKYLQNLNDLVSKYIDQPLPQFRGPNNKPASFDDLVWYFIWPNGRRTRILCTLFNQTKYLSDSSLTNELQLTRPYSYLHKVYLIHLLSDKLSASEYQSKAIDSRKILSQISTSLDDLPTSIWQLSHSNSFYHFCRKYHLISLRSTPSIKKDFRDRSGDIAIDNKKKKMASEDSIIMLASIFHDTFEHVKQDGAVIPGHTVDISDALVTTFILLSLASPNRMSSEIPVLTKQKLQNFSEADGEKVYFFEWQGSKGFKNNKNHILSSLAKEVDRAINFFNKHTEPARILARFYKDQNITLKNLLQDYKIEQIRLNNLSLDDKPNLFTLGYALGFYNHNETVRIITTPTHDLPLSRKHLISSHFSTIPIYHLRKEHRLFVTCSSDNSSLKQLMQITIRHQFITKHLKPIMTIQEVEFWWINYFKTELIPSFPIAYSSSESSVNVLDAAFLLRSSEISKGGSKEFELHPYALKTPNQLGSYIRLQLNKPKNINNKAISIFEKHGFGDKIKVSLHQFRHFTNDTASRSDIPIEIITAWSGRKDPDQTYTYIHQSDSEKADRLSAIINPPKTSKEGIIPIAMKDITNLANLPASITSSGICTQELNTTPCDYLNDFVSQCFMCSSACHVAGDEKAAYFLKKDLSFQENRLSAISKDPRLKSSDAMKSWYKIHKHQTMVLSQLIDIMNSYPEGSIIRYSSRTKDFKLTDLKTNTITSITLNLADSKPNIDEITPDSSYSNNENPSLKALLSNYDLPLEDL